LIAKKIKSQNILGNFWLFVFLFVDKLARVTRIKKADLVGYEVCISSSCVSIVALILLAETKITQNQIS